MIPGVTYIIWHMQYAPCYDDNTQTEQEQGEPPLSCLSMLPTCTERPKRNAAFCFPTAWVPMFRNLKLPKSACIARDGDGMHTARPANGSSSKAYLQLAIE
jgi:hypothetical protein